MRPGLRMMMMQGGQDGRRMDYDDPNRRRIGFGANDERRHELRRKEVDEPHRMMGGDYPIPEMTYPSNITPLPRVYPQRASMHEPQHERNGQEPGRAGGEFWMIPPAHEKKLTREKAEKWVRKMARHGESWTFEDAKRLGEECGVPDDMQSQVDFYAALNMMASDYGKVARKYGVDNEKFYADLAMAFLRDEDGKRPAEKLAAYYKSVVPHDEE